VHPDRFGPGDGGNHSQQAEQLVLVPRDAQLNEVVLVGQVPTAERTDNERVDSRGADRFTTSVDVSELTIWRIFVSLDNYGQ